MELIVSLKCLYIECVPRSLSSFLTHVSQYPLRGCVLCSVSQLQLLQAMRHKV